MSVKTNYKRAQRGKFVSINKLSKFLKNYKNYNLFRLGSTDPKKKNSRPRFFFSIFFFQKCSNIFEQTFFFFSKVFKFKGPVPRNDKQIPPPSVLIPLSWKMRNVLKQRGTTYYRPSFLLFLASHIPDRKRHKGTFALGVGVPLWFPFLRSSIISSPRTSSFYQTCKLGAISIKN